MSVQCFHDFIYTLGTFAVISLMIGSVVDRGLQSRGITLNTFNETITSDDGSTVFIGTDNSAEVLQAKLGLAMAVTFGVGCVQVPVLLTRLSVVGDISVLRHWSRLFGESPFASMASFELYKVVVFNCKL